MDLLNKYSYDHTKRLARTKLEKQPYKPIESINISMRLTQKIDRNNANKFCRNVFYLFSWTHFDSLMLPASTHEIWTWRYMLKYSWVRPIEVFR